MKRVEKVARNGGKWGIRGDYGEFGSFWKLFYSNRDFCEPFGSFWKLQLDI